MSDKQRRRRARVADALQRERRPATSATRPALASSSATRASASYWRRRTSAKRASRQASISGVCGCSSSGATAPICVRHPINACATSAAADGSAIEAQALGHAPAHGDRRVLQRGHERRNRALVADQSECEGGGGANVGLDVAQRAGERRDAFRHADASHREHGATAHHRIGIGGEREEVRRRGRHERQSGRRRGGEIVHRQWRIARALVPQGTLLLEPVDPGDLRVERNDRRRRRCGGDDGSGNRRRPAAGRKNHQRRGGRQQRGSWPSCVRHATNLSRWMVAALTRSGTGSTPIPAPAGTAIVPSTPTSIGGSIRSGTK